MYVVSLGISGWLLIESHDMLVGLSQSLLVQQSLVSKSMRKPLKMSFLIFSVTQATAEYYVSHLPPRCTFLSSGP
ncbi:MAG: hypothetical protein C4K48_12065 [Candidatus Thorarchaeota archaeon]|nr:MAG: hypothetical protein C4K48_12065 [Candidatus Thorarchaeota archaeon]